MIDGSSSPPDLSEDQRRAGSQRAALMRNRRAALRAQVSSGEATPAEIIALAEDGDEAARGLPVFRLITAVPGCGPVLATRLLSELSIPANRRIGGLSPVHAIQLIAILRHTARSPRVQRG